MRVRGMNVTKVTPRVLWLRALQWMTRKPEGSSASLGSTLCRGGLQAEGFDVANPATKSSDFGITGSSPAQASRQRWGTSNGLGFERERFRFAAH